MVEEINWKEILDSSAQLIAEHGKKIKALEVKVENLRVGNILEKQVIKRIDALESALKDVAEMIFDEDDYKEWLKQLEAKK